MSEYRYNTWLSQYKLLVRDLDATYGGPNYTKHAQIKGRQSLLNILDHLASHRQSSCEDIATIEFHKKPTNKRKIKSITDDVRKFVNNNLIPVRIVEEDGFKKVYNKRVKTYSLTPFGILYSIHLLSEKKGDARIINNLSSEYQETLPKVFDKFPFFEKMFGSNFIDIMGIQKLADTGESISNSPPSGILSVFVKESGGAYYGNPILLIGRWVNQISLVIYCNILNHLQWKAESEHWRTRENLQLTQRRKIGSFWKEIDRIDPGIMKWFFDYVKEASSVYRVRVKSLAQVKRWFY